MTMTSQLTSAGESPSLRSVLLSTVTAHPERPALTYRTEANRPGRSAARRRHRLPTWHTLSWHEFGHLVMRTLDRLPGLVGDAETVAILADTDARYPVLELALALSGRTVQPLYVTAPDEELRRALL